MLDIGYIFDIRTTTLPMSKDILSNCLDRTPVCGYIYCKYGNLIKTINTINSATELNVTMNPNKMYFDISNPELSPEVVIKVEGIRQSDEAYLNRVIKYNDKESWTDFTTYSDELRDDIKNLKEKTFKEILWNNENIDTWFNNNNIELLASSKQEYVTNWNKFRDAVMGSNDLIHFVNSCSDETRAKYTNSLIKRAGALLNKYKDEITAHLRKTYKDLDEVMFTNPIIDTIYITSSKTDICKKEHPKIKFVSLSQRNFNLIGTFG